MKEFRKAKGVTEHYTSLEEMAKAWGCKGSPIKQTRDKEKLQKQRENFCNFHKCKACGQPMTYIGESVMTCTNDKCKGIKHERKDNDGNTIVTYSVSYEILEEKYAEKARNIFHEAN